MKEENLLKEENLKTEVNKIVKSEAMGPEYDAKENAIEVRDLTIT